MKRGRPISRWQECRDAISEIAQEAVKYDADGVEVNFLNSKASKTCKVAVLPHCRRDGQLTSTRRQSTKWKDFSILSKFQVGTFAD